MPHDLNAAILTLTLASLALGGCDARPDDDADAADGTAANATGDFTFASGPANAVTLSSAGDVTFGTNAGGVSYSSVAPNVGSGVTPSSAAAGAGDQPAPGTALVGTDGIDEDVGATPDEGDDGAETIVFSDSPFDGYWERAEPLTRDRRVFRIVRLDVDRYDVDSFDDERDNLTGEPLNCFELWRSYLYGIDDDERFEEVGETIRHLATIAGNSEHPNFSYDADADRLIRTPGYVDAVPAPGERDEYVRTMDGLAAQDIPLCD